MSVFALCSRNPAKSLLGSPLPLNYKNLVFLTANADLLNPALGGMQPMHMNKKACFNQLLALMNLATMIWVFLFGFLGLT